MKYTPRLALIFVFIVMSIQHSVGQEKDYFGEYRPAVEAAIGYLRIMQQKDASALKKDFEPTSFQTKKEFQRAVSSDNLKWASQIIAKHGIPGDEQTAISVWKTGAGNMTAESVSINVSFYFRDQSLPMSLISDRICINLTTSGNEYKIDGILLFRQSDYEAMQRAIQDMP